MVASLARIQKRRGAQVRIICFSQIGALEATVRNDGVEIYRCQQNPVGASAMGKLRAVLELRRELRAWRTDIVHCHDIPTTLYGAPAARLAGVRGLFCTRHSCRPDVIRNERSFWRVMRLCDRAVAVSESVQDTLTALPYARAVQIVTIRTESLHRPLRRLRARGGALRWSWWPGFPRRRIPPPCYAQWPERPARVPESDCS